MARRHYHVCNSFPGCLPESGPAVFTRRVDAEHYVRETEEENEEQGSQYVVDIFECTEDRPECREEG